MPFYFNQEINRSRNLSSLIFYRKTYNFIPVKWINNHISKYSVPAVFFLEKTPSRLKYTECWYYVSTFLRCRFPSSYNQCVFIIRTILLKFLHKETWHRIKVRFDFKEARANHFSADHQAVCIMDVWCLTRLSTIFQLYRGCKFYWRRKLEYPEKTTDLSLSLTNFMT